MKLGKRSGRLEVYGKRGKYRGVPLNATAREALEEWIDSLPKGLPWLFPSRKKSAKRDDGERETRPITVRALG